MPCAMPCSYFNARTIHGEGEATIPNVLWSTTTRQTAGRADAVVHVPILADQVSRCARRLQVGSSE